MILHGMVDFLIYEPFLSWPFVLWDMMDISGHSLKIITTPQGYIRLYIQNRMKTDDYNWFIRLTFTVYISQACCSFLNLMLRCGCGGCDGCGWL